MVLSTAAFMDGYMCKAAEDMDPVVRTVLGEARGQGPREMKLVVDVIANRVAKRKLTPEQVVKQRKQFSFWNDPKGHNYKQTMSIPATDPLYVRALQILRARLANKSKDWTGGATHYYNPKRANPSWGGPHFKPIQGSTHVYGTAR